MRNSVIEVRVKESLPVEITFNECRSTTLRLVNIPNACVILFWISFSSHPCLRLCCQTTASFPEAGAVFDLTAKPNLY